MTPCGSLQGNTKTNNNHDKRRAAAHVRAGKSSLGGDKKANLFLIDGAGGIVEVPKDGSKYGFLFPRP